MMPACLFNKGFFSKEKCTVESPNMEALLKHVRREHGAVAWSMGTLVAAQNEWLVLDEDVKIRKDWRDE